MQPATCSDAGAAAIGPADMHCSGMPAQPTDMASCHPDVAVGGDDGGGSGDDGGGSGGDGGDIGNCGDPTYGPTMFGTQGADDDCKYDLTWISTPICENGNVFFTVTVKNKTDGSPVTGANVRPDVVLACMHPTPGVAADPSPEPSPGTYKVGPVVFDKPGRWVVRFHIHEDCLDLLPTSPHGHAAFWVNVP